MVFQIRPKQPISVRHNQNDPMRRAKGGVEYKNVAKKISTEDIRGRGLKMGFLVKMHEGALEAKTGCLKKMMEN